jgi:fumarate hydratase class I
VSVKKNVKKSIKKKTNSKKVKTGKVTKAKTVKKTKSQLNTKKSQPQKNQPKKKQPKKNQKVGGDDKTLEATLVELIRVTSAELPNDVQKVILEALEREEKNTTAEYAMNIIKANIELAKKKSQPLCQDTGTVLFYVSHPIGFNQSKFSKLILKAVISATKKGYLRQNSVDSLTGENSGLKCWARASFYSFS